MFNIYDYNENLEYCEYVYRKNIELSLNLNPEAEIQYIANKYCEAVLENFEDNQGEIIEDDLLLLKVVSENIKAIKNYWESYEVYPFAGQIDPDRLDVLAKRKYSYGGYGLTEEYDDQGLDTKDEVNINTSRVLFIHENYFDD